MTSYAECYQKGAYYEGIKFLNTLPINNESLNHDINVSKQALTDCIISHPFCIVQNFTSIKNEKRTRVNFCEQGSSVSIVPGYGLDDRAIEVRTPAEAKDFSSSLCIQTGSGALPASCKMGTGGPFPGAKVRPGRDADHSPPPSAEVENG
jgi:hypothetical protein